MADEAGNREAFRIQQGYCEAMDAPITARVCAVLATSLARDSRTGARVLDWPGEPTADAMPLRLVGGLHALVLAEKAPDLSRVFSGERTAPDAVARALADTLIAHDAALLPWLDGPPQTNEPGRSGALMTGLLHVAARLGPRIEIMEIGSSAGLNLLIDRYRFDLGGTVAGPETAPVTIRPVWRGSPPPQVPIAFTRVRGCDVQPIDVTDATAAARLAAYVWVDNPQRQERLLSAIAMIRQQPMHLEKADAAAWVEARLAEPHPEGVTRTLMHSVVWQYLPPRTQARITAAMEAAGRAATAQRPLAWVHMEPDRVFKRQEISVRMWPGGDDKKMVAIAQAHGAWVEGLV